MKTGVKRVGWLLGLAVLLVAAALVTIAFLVDPNDYKDHIASAVRTHTGRELTIQGDIRLTFFPWLGAEVGAVALSNPPGFPGEPFAQADRLHVRVKLIPLLRRQLEMDTVTVQGLHLNLHRNAERHTNWDDLVARVGEPNQTKGEPRPIALLALGGVDLKDAAVTWTDAVTGHDYHVKGLTVSTGPLALDQPVPVTIAFDFQASKPAVQGQVRGTVDLSAEQRGEVFRAIGLQLHARATGAALPGGELTLAVSGNGVLDQAQRSLGLTALNVEIPGVNVRGTSGTLKLQGEATADLATGRYELPNMGMEAELSGQHLPDAGLTVTASARLSGNLEEQTLSIRGLNVQAAELEAQGNIEITALLGELRYSGTVETAAFNLRALLAQFGAKDVITTDAKALTTGMLRAGIEGTAKRMRFKPLTLRIDDTTVQGVVELGADSGPGARFDLVADALDADRYLPPRAETTGAISPGAASTALPFEALRALNLGGTLRVEKLKVANIKIDNAEIRLDASEGVVKLSPVKARLYRGSYSGNIGIDVRGDTPTVTLDERLLKVQLGRLLKDFQGDGVDPMLADAEGDLTLRATVTAIPGTQAYDIKAFTLRTNLAGKGLPTGKLEGGIAGNLKLDPAGDAVIVDDLSLDLFGVKATGGVTVQDAFKRERRLAGTLKAPRFNLRQAITRAGLTAPRTRKAQALTRAQVSTAFDASADGVALKSLELKLDSSTLTGRLEVARLSTPAPHARFELALDRIDLDAYLAPEPKGSGASDPVLPIPVEILRQWNVDGSLKVGSLKLNGLRSQSVKVTARGKGGKLVLNPLHAGLYSGALTGLIAVDARGKRPEITMDSQMIEVALGPLLQDFLGRSPVTGLVNARLNGRASGITKNELVRNLTGTLDYDVSRGTVEQIDMASTLCLTASEGGRTPFTELRGKVGFAQGRATNQDLYMNSPVVELQEQEAQGGYVDLLSERINLFLAAKLGAPCAGTVQTLGALGAILGRKVKELRQLRNLDCVAQATVQFPVTGTLSNPDYDALRRAAQETWNDCASQEASVASGQPEQPTQAQPQQPSGSIFEEILRRQLEGALGR